MRVVSVQTGLPKEGAVVRFHIDAVTTSGGHDHGEKHGRRSRGSISNSASSTCVAALNTTPDTYDCTTDPNGYTGFTFNAPDVSGTQTIDADCISANCSGSVNHDIKVMVGGLEIIPSSEFYTLLEDDGTVIGAVKNVHTDNHYLTPAAASVLWRIAAAYHTEQKFKVIDPTTNTLVAPPVLHLNDASLVWGGLFDKNGNWKTPHDEHRRGTVVDVRANSNTGAIPDKNLKEFNKLVIYFEADPHPEGLGTTNPNRHFHLRLLNRPE